MTNDEFQMTKEIRMTNSKCGTLAPDVFIGSFELRHSFDIRHSGFVIFRLLLALPDANNRPLTTFNEA